MLPSTMEGKPQIDSTHSEMLGFYENENLGYPEVDSLCADKEV